jgi:hypothetical protein
MRKVCRVAVFRKSSHGRPMVREDGGPNKTFLTFLFCDQTMAIKFLQDVGLLRSKVKCNTCGRDKVWSADTNIREGFRLQCRRKVGGAKCSKSRSIKHGS